MALGCVLIFLCVLALFRRRMRAKAAKCTAAFAAAKNIDARGGEWGGARGSARSSQEERHVAALGKVGVVGGTGSDAGGGGCSALPSQYARSRRLLAGGGDAESFYLQLTGLPPRAPVPRRPVTTRGVERTDSWRTVDSSMRSITEAQRYAKSVEQRDDEPEQGSIGSGDGGGRYWFEPAGTGSGQASRNPFRK
ncbi:hypothetical protein BC827DRAFT_1376453 [Russula dissimulans]|nr:hypothetical protein BC827DRAFT_1376453 [Russula dissimulans]